MKEDQTLGEVFLLKTFTKDGYPIIIGGICHKGKTNEVVEAYTKIETREIGKYKDEYIIDYILADSIAKLSPKGILIVAASIHIRGVKNRTGGIIGNPFKEYTSARGEIDEIIPGIFLLSFSGGPGVAFQGTYEEALDIRKLIIKNKKDEEVIKKLDEVAALYIFASDGSGIDSCGRIHVSDANGNKEEGFSNNNS